MARLFLDTSALVKLYVREPGSDRVLGLAGAAGTRLFLLVLARVELRSALRRRERSGDIGREDAGAAIAQFERDWGRQFLVQAVTESVLSAAVQSVDRHGLRALDALQLGACLVLSAGTGEMILVSCDRELNRAGAEEGLRVFDPTAAG